MNVWVSGSSSLWYYVIQWSCVHELIHYVWHNCMKEKASDHCLLWLECHDCFSLIYYFFTFQNSPEISNEKYPGTCRARGLRQEKLKSIVAVAITICYNSQHIIHFCQFVPWLSETSILKINNLLLVPVTWLYKVVPDQLWLSSNSYIM